ncbi:hypothetical protein E4H12_06345 [Candidatus Thorarchaeota archaeon]|nr:MAG: hypothetical protein E4H12_06345 [Candidatus Thorarchaeota archaeon]
MASKQKQGYVVTRAASLAEYFTASAAYDRPTWVELSEATVYASPDLAQHAAKKLWMSGSFAAKVINISELMDLELEMPPKGEDQHDDEDPEMVAARQSDSLDDEVKGTCPECDCDPCECDDAAQADGVPTDTIPSDDMEGGMDDMEGGGEDDLERGGREGEEHAFLHPEELRMLGRKRLDMKECKVGDFVIPNMGPHKGAKHEVIHVFDDGAMNIKPVGLRAKAIKYRLGAVKAKPDQVKLVEAEFKMPKRPGNDPAAPDENDTTVATMTDPKSTQVDFEDPVGTEDKPRTDLTYSGAMEHDEKCPCPAEIMSQLKAVISDFEKAAKDNDENMNDETKAAFEKTAASALQQLADDLALGTVAGVKQAQIHMTSYMNPITSHIPADVTNFIGRGGRKSSLKDLFAVKWDNVRGTQ